MARFIFLFFLLVSLLAIGYIQLIGPNKIWEYVSFRMNTHWGDTNLSRPNCITSSLPDGPNFYLKYFLIFCSPPLISTLESGPPVCTGGSHRSPVP